MQLCGGQVELTRRGDSGNKGAHLGFPVRGPLGSPCWACILALPPPPGHWLSLSRPQCCQLESGMAKADLNEAIHIKQ